MAKRPDGFSGLLIPRRAALPGGLVLLFLLLPPLLRLSAAGDGRVLRAYRVHYLEAEEAAERIRALLSPDAGLTVDASNNTVIVNDRAGVQRRVAETLRRLDAAPLRLRMSTVFLDDTDLRELALPLRWSEAGGGWGVGRFRGAESFPVRRAVARAAEAAVSRGHRRSVVELTPGRAAAVWSRPVRRSVSALRRYLRRHNYVQGPFRAEDLRAGILVRLRRSGGKGERYRVELLPRISFRRGTERVYLELPEARGAFELRLGQWVLLSGGTAVGHDLLTLLFGGIEGSRDLGFNFLVRLRRADGA